MEYFRIYGNAEELVNELTDEQAGRVFRALFAYSVGNELPELDIAERLVFKCMRTILDNDAKAYEATCERNATNASRGGAPKGNGNARKSKTTSKQPKTAKSAKNNQNNRSVVFDEQGENAPAQITENSEDTQNNRSVVFDKKTANSEGEKQKTTQSLKDKEKDKEKDKDKYNSLSLSLSPLSSEKAGDEVAKEKQRVFEIFYFEKNFIEPKNEVERFFDYYTANGWQRNGATIRDKIALAKLWKPQKEGNREDPELLGWLYATYANAKTSDPASADTILHGIHRTAVETKTNTTAGGATRCGTVWCDKAAYLSLETYKASTSLAIGYKVLKTA